MYSCLLLSSRTHLLETSLKLLQQQKYRGEENTTASFKKYRQHCRRCAMGPAAVNRVLDRKNEPVCQTNKLKSKPFTRRTQFQFHFFCPMYATCRKQLRQNTKCRTTEVYSWFLPEDRHQITLPGSLHHHFSGKLYQAARSCWFENKI